MGCHSWVHIWPKFYLCNFCAMYTIVPYIATIYRELKILNQVEWCIYASVKSVNIGSHIGLSPVRRLALIWTNAYLLLGIVNQAFRSKVHQFWIKRQSFWKCRLQNMSQPQCVNLPNSHIRKLIYEYYGLVKNDFGAWFETDKLYT